MAKARTKVAARTPKPVMRRVLALAYAADAAGMPVQSFEKAVASGAMPVAFDWFGLPAWDALDLIGEPYCGAHCNDAVLPQGTVYVVGFQGYVKIGFTGGDVPTRIVGLQTGCPERLKIYAELPGSMHTERALQKRFAAHATLGDWFRNEGAIAEWIAEGCPI